MRHSRFRLSTNSSMPLNLLDSMDRKIFIRYSSEAGNALLVSCLAARYSRPYSLLFSPTASPGPGAA